jgi:hypothetical protein
MVTSQEFVCCRKATEESVKGSVVRYSMMYQLWGMVRVLSKFYRSTGDRSVKTGGGEQRGVIACLWYLQELDRIFRKGYR